MYVDRGSSVASWEEIEEIKKTVTDDDTGHFHVTLNNNLLLL